MPARNLVWLISAAVISLICYAEAGRNRYAGMLSDSIDKIANYYVEPVEPRQLFEGGLRGMLSELDPYSGYIAPQEFNQFRVDIEQRFGGIGIEVGIENEQITVLNPVPGSPAYQAGLMAGDVIVSIDGQDVTGATLDDAVKLMRGEIGTMVRVEVLHRGETETKTYEIERAEIRIESVRGDLRDARGHWRFRLEEHPRLAYIRLMSFGDRTASDLEAALRSIDGQVDGLIMDLRGNAGGLLSAAVEICDMFIPAGRLIVSTRGRDPDWNEEFWSDQSPQVDPNLPIVVLVDRFSASASEIFAACLQDYGRAVVVGERTWGKGTVQNVIELEGGRSAIRLTTQTYWRPSGENIHRHRDDQEEDAWGVQPAKENKVEFDADQYRGVYEARRQRDYIDPNESAPAAPVSEDEADNSSDNSSDKAATEDTASDESAAVPDDIPDDVPDDDTPADGIPADGRPVVDRQLQRAVEILLTQLQAKAAA